MEHIDLGFNEEEFDAETLALLEEVTAPVEAIVDQAEMELDFGLTF